MSIETRILCLIKNIQRFHKRLQGNKSVQNGKYIFCIEKCVAVIYTFYKNNRFLKNYYYHYYVDIRDLSKVFVADLY